MLVNLESLCDEIIDCPHSTPQWQKYGFIVLRNYNLENNKIDNTNLSFVTKEEYINRTKRAKPIYQDIVFSREAPIGACAMIPENYTCCLGQRLVLLRANKTICNPLFLLYALQSDVVKKQIGIFENRGSTVSNLNIGYLKTLQVPYTMDIDKQSKIANILFDIDTQLERNNNIIKRLQVLGNTIYSKNAKVQTSTFNIESVCKPIWGNCPAGEYILSQYSDNTIPYASGAGDIDNNVSVNPKSFTNKPTRVVHENDICISVAGTVGKIAIATEDICIGRAMLGFANPKLYGYIYFGLNSYTAALQQKATGAIQKIINSEHLSIVNLPTYTDDVIESLNLIVDEMLRIEKHTKQLHQLKEKLLPLLINGQLSI